MLRRLFVAAVVLVALLGAAFPAYAHHHKHHHHHHKHHHSSSDSGGPGGRSKSDSSSDSSSSSSSGDDASTADTPGDTSTAMPATGAVAASGPQQSTMIQLTGYGAPDNNPAGSKKISQPVIHQQAGGSCTFSDPVTFASPGSAGSTEFPKGQKVYFPKIKCYGISEDSGATKESIKHIDIYTGDGPKSVTDKCESDLTGKTNIIVNPPAGEPVNPGPLSTSSGCHVAASGDTGTAGHHKKKDSSS